MSSPRHHRTGNGRDLARRLREVKDLEIHNHHWQKQLERDANLILEFSNLLSTMATFTCLHCTAGAGFVRGVCKEVIDVDSGDSRWSSEEEYERVKKLNNPDTGSSTSVHHQMHAGGEEEDKSPSHHVDANAVGQAGPGPSTAMYHRRSQQVTTSTTDNAAENAQSRHNSTQKSFKRLAAGLRNVRIHTGEFAAESERYLCLPCYEDPDLNCCICAEAQGSEFIPASLKPSRGESTSGQPADELPQSGDSSASSLALSEDSFVEAERQARISGPGLQIPTKAQEQADEDEDWEHVLSLSISEDEAYEAAYKQQAERQRAGSASPSRWKFFGRR